jgi:hypothetical protein
MEIEMTYRSNTVSKAMAPAVPAETNRLRGTSLVEINEISKFVKRVSTEEMFIQVHEFCRYRLTLWTQQNDTTSPVSNGATSLMRLMSQATRGILKARRSARRQAGVRGAEPQ